MEKSTPALFLARRRVLGLCLKTELAFLFLYRLSCSATRRRCRKVLVGRAFCSFFPRANGHKYIVPALLQSYSDFLLKIVNFQINAVGKMLENNKYCAYNRITLIKPLEVAFMSLFKKSFLFLFFITFFVFAASAKDSAGITIQVGAIGSEQTSYSYSTLSGGTISMPYSKTTFNPDFYFGIGIPVCDIGEICFFGFDFGYNCSLKYSYSSFSTSQSKSSAFSHKISFMPEFTFVKSNFRFFVGTGFAFGFEPYQYEGSSLGVKTISESNTFKIFWTFETGVKYKFGKHLFAVADITFFAAAFEAYNDDDFKSRTSGGSTMEFLPKIGLEVQF